MGSHVRTPISGCDIDFNFNILNKFYHLQNVLIGSILTKFVEATSVEETNWVIMETNVGDPGLQGQKGEKGEKGDSPPQSPPTVFNIESATKGDIKIYKTRCHGFCRDVTVKLEYDRGGDADLYTKEDSPPTESDFGSSCSNCLCTSKIATPPDECVVTTRSGNSFYTAVYAHKSYHNGKITFDGTNYKSTSFSVDRSKSGGSDSRDQSQ